MKNVWAWITRSWCHYMHAALMWPVHGHYECRVCHKTYPVVWANGASQLANCLAKTYLVRKHQWRERRFVTTSTQPGNQLSASSTS